MQYTYTATALATAKLAGATATLAFKRTLPNAWYATPQLVHSVRLLTAICNAAATPVSLPALLAAIVPLAPANTKRATPALTAAVQHLWAMQRLSTLQSQGLLCIAQGSVTQAN